MDFRSDTIKLFGIVYKDILVELMEFNEEAISYLSFISNLSLSLNIYQEVLEELKSSMTEEEKEKFLLFENFLSEAMMKKEMSKDEQN